MLYSVFVYFELIYMNLPFKISVKTNVFIVVIYFQKPGRSGILDCVRKQNNAKARRYESPWNFHLSHKRAECNRVATEKWEKNRPSGKASSLVKFPLLG